MGIPGFKSTSAPGPALAAGRSQVRPLRRRLHTILLALLFASPAFTAIETDDPTREAPDGDEIVGIDVTGYRPGALRKLMHEFILEVGEPVNSRGYARWQDEVCVGVFNLPDRSIAQYIADQISLTALEARLEVGSSGCNPNLKIVFSPDARELATTLVEQEPLLFLPFGNAGPTTQGRAALERFKTSEAPVRWWQITMVVNEYNIPATVLAGINDVAPNGGGNWVVPMSRGEVSRLKSGVNDSIWDTLIIVDAGKLGNVTWPQLADYLSMVSLTQVAHDAQPRRYSSILNLFSADSPPPGMTEMDRVYLRSLYEMNTMMLPHTQRGVFSNQMVRILRKELDGE